MAVSIPFSPGGEYFGEFRKSMTDDPAGKELTLKIAKGLTTEYFLALIHSFAAMGSLHEEIAQIINDFSGRRDFVFRQLPIDHIILLIKFYIVQWCTLSDLTAIIISQGFNLGIADQDISFAVIARNKHIRQSELHAQLGRYKKELDVDEYICHRNGIVHRGRVADDATLDLKAKWDTLHGRKFSLLTANPISDEEYQKESKQLSDQNFELGARLQTKYEEHYRKTIAVITEICRILARRTIALLEQGAI